MSLTRSTLTAGPLRSSNSPAPVVKAALLLLLASACGGGCATVGKDIDGVCNFACVDGEAPEAAIYRGAQPTPRGVQALADMGVRTVIDLRDDFEPWERGAVEAAGMHYVSIPTNARRCDPESIRLFLQTLRTCERPAFVHCRRGRDRTGMELAIYRIVDRGATREQAMRELYAHGYQWAMFPNIRQYLMSFDSAQFAPAPLLPAIAGAPVAQGAVAGAAVTSTPPPGDAVVGE